MVQIYRKKWQRGVFSSTIGYLRDWLVLASPFRRLPSWLVKILYGSAFKFAFLVHPRAYQDVFVSMPSFKFFKFFLPRQKGYLFFSRTTPFVLNRINTVQKTNGIVIAQLTVPEVMFEKRKETLQMLHKSILLASKICETGAVIGLGGWYPMITKRGNLLHEYSRSLNVNVTNGHCGTLASIYMTIEKIARICGKNLETLTIGIIGAGKMGTNVARVLYGKVERLILIDINMAQLVKVKNELTKVEAFTQIDCVLSDPTNKNSLRDVLRRCHIGVCATSTFRNVIKLRDLPENFIGIDDSRPEALPRDVKKERIILEGGLLKIANAEINYNYGFGEDGNVFGCLGEAFLLALDGCKTLKPTLGDVDKDNFFNMLDFCKKSGVSEGDFKTSHLSVSQDDIKYAIDMRDRSRQQNESSIS